MSCPYFQPAGQIIWPSAPKLPLGDAYSGLCRADAAGGIEPGIAELKDLCNLGYARGRCARFPQADGPDAVRFAVTHHADGIIRVSWVREKDHHPLDHGPLEYALADQKFTTSDADQAVRDQAHAYIESYLRRKARHRVPS